MATRGKKLIPEEIAYIAGLFDGEGCVNIYKIDTPKTYAGGERKKYPRYELTTSIYNCNKDVLSWLHETFGGYLQTRHRYKKPEQVELGKWKKSYAWKLSANQAKMFLEMIVANMRIKKQQAQLAIEFQTARSKKRNRCNPITPQENNLFRKCWEQMKELNQKGALPATTKRGDL